MKQNIEINEGEVVIAFVMNGVLFSEKKKVEIIKDPLKYKLYVDRLTMSYIYAQGKSDNKWSTQEEFRDRVSS